MTEGVLAKCGLEGCGGPQSGVCINGLSFDECPDVVLAEAEPASDVLEEDQTAAEISPSTTNVGDSLDAISCDALLRATGGHLIGIVAGPEAGKTTLVATIYELLHRGRFPELGFAGSESLRGYEERAYLSRLASERHSADTARTKTWEKLSFTHLRIAVNETRIEALFSDRSGEHFENVLDAPDMIAGFEELTRADRLWIIVDLDLLVKDGHALKSRLRKIVMAMEAAGIFHGKDVDIIGTKADMLAADQIETVAQGFREFAEDLKGRMGDEGSRANLHMVACRPRAGETEFGQGLAELVTSLKEGEVIETCSILRSYPPNPSLLDKLMERFGVSA